MTDFTTAWLPEGRDAVAPDGSDVRILLSLRGGSMAHFSLAPQEISTAVAHRTVEEIWYVLAGHGAIWRKQGDREAVAELEAGLCLTIPVGTHFQFRAFGGSALAILGVTMPCWPGDGEAYGVAGKWTPTVPQLPLQRR